MARDATDTIRDDTMGECNPGLRESRTLLVTDEHCADRVGSGDVPVLSTPALLALAEGACVSAIASDLDEGQTTVGQWAEIEHLLPTLPGSVVEAGATLVGHHGRRLEFKVIVREGDDVVAKIRHRRVLVDRERFLAKVGLSGDAA